ncbi:MAG TPA: VTT domain-containing protein [Acidimicrobiales bacterium]
MHALTPTHLINTYGLWGLIAIIFAESGLFFGFFLPGDSLLVTAGILASTHKAHDVHLDLAAVLIGCCVAAVAGDQVGYGFGSRVGQSLFTRPESRLFKPKYVQQAHEYLDERGAKMIVLARFVPAVRTFTPIVAGAGRMKYRLFVPYNVAGGVGWVCAMTLLGYAAGSTVSNIDRYLVPVVLVVIVLSFIPVALEIRRSRRGAGDRLTPSSDEP